jgi:hypothetical protein
VLVARPAVPISEHARTFVGMVVDILSTIASHWSAAVLGIMEMDMDMDVDVDITGLNTKRTTHRKDMLAF